MQHKAFYAMNMKRQMTFALIIPYLEKLIEI